MLTHSSSEVPVQFPISPTHTLDGSSGYWVSSRGKVIIIFMHGKDMFMNKVGLELWSVSGLCNNNVSSSINSEI